MRDYEIAVLYHPDLETNLDPALDKVAKLIEANGGKITNIDAEGKKKMAYAMKGQDFALYYYYQVQLPPDAPNKLAAVMTITDEILRAQIVLMDPRRDEYQEYLKEKEAREAEQVEAAEEAKEDVKKDSEEDSKEEAKEDVEEKEEA